MTFAGKKAVVTGGTGALGSVICQAFLDREADVFSSYIEDPERERAEARFKNDPRFHLARVDLSSEEQVTQWFDAIGRPDVLVNVAGGFAMGPVGETSLETWLHQLAMNLNTAFLSCREALRRMDARKQGRIINVGAFAATRPAAGLAAYSVSKRGVIQLTETLAEETLEGNVTVNAILPTIMDTPANRAAMPEADPASWVPLENVAHTVLFLADPRSWHITGACIPLRGHN